MSKSKWPITLLYCALVTCNHLEYIHLCIIDLSSIITQNTKVKSDNTHINYNHRNDVIL